MQASRRPRWGAAMGVIAGILASGCVPLGIWVFTEPVVTVSSISFNGDSTRPVELTLQVRNPNDFDVELEQVQLLLSIRGQAVVDTAIDAAVTLLQLERRDVTLNVQQQMMAAGFSVSSMQPGRHPYAVSGEAHLSTPIGIRRIKFQQAGEGDWASTAGPAQELPLAKGSSAR